eukprot:1182067-Prorocentrum_minimum.AAC.2
MAENDCRYQAGSDDGEEPGARLARARPRAARLTRPRPRPCAPVAAAVFRRLPRKQACRDGVVPGDHHAHLRAPHWALAHGEDSKHARGGRQQHLHLRAGVRALRGAAHRLHPRPHPRRLRHRHRRASGPRLGRARPRQVPAESAGGGGGGGGVVRGARYQLHGHRRRPALFGPVCARRLRQPGDRRHRAHLWLRPGGAVRRAQRL